MILLVEGTDHRGTKVVPLAEEFGGAEFGGECFDQNTHETVLDVADIPIWHISGLATECGRGCSKNETVLLFPCLSMVVGLPDEITLLTLLSVALVNHNLRGRGKERERERETETERAKSHVKSGLFAGHTGVVHVVYSV